MKVVLDKQEIQEAVQCYVNIVLGSSLNVTDLTVIQGRESNGARIELELSKYLPPIDLDDMHTLAKPIQEEAEPEKVKQEVAEEKVEKEVTPVDVPATPKKTRQAVAALNTPVEDDDEEEQIPMDNSPVTEPNPVPADAVAPKSASVMTTGMSPLPGSFFSNN